MTTGNPNLRGVYVLRLKYEPGIEGVYSTLGLAQEGIRGVWMVGLRRWTNATGWIIEEHVIDAPEKDE